MAGNNPFPMPVPPQPAQQTPAPMPTPQASPLAALIPLLGGLGGTFGGNPQAGAGFLRGYTQAQQHLAQAKQQQFEQQRQADQLRLQHNQDERAGNADTRAQQDQYIQAVNSVRQLLGDNSIDNPADYATREQFVSNLAPKLGVDPGFIQSLRPKPDVFTQRKLQKVYDSFSKLPESERLQFEQGGHWDINGQLYTPAQARQALGVGGQTATGEPFAFSKPPAVNSVNAGSFEDYVIRYAKGHKTTPDALTTADIQQARKEYNQADDKAATGGGPRDRYSVQPTINPDGTTGLVRINLDTGEVSRVALPDGIGSGRGSDTERLSKAYMDRTTASDTTAVGFEKKLTDLGPQFDVQLPNLLKSPAGRQYKQAEDEFINAALRRESGAAIQPSEYERFERIYFVRPGDDAATIAQKQQARERVIEGFRVAAGNMGRVSATTPPPASTARTGTIPNMAPMPAHGAVGAADSARAKLGQR